MEDNFDQHIKRMLENLEADYNPSDWNRMEESLDAQDKINPEIEDVYLDGMAYDTLNNIKVDYEPMHWDLMKERLDDPFAIRRRLMKYKVMEIAVVALFLLTLVQFFPERGNVLNKKVAVENHEVEVRNNKLESGNEQLTDDQEIQVSIANNQVANQETKNTTPAIIANAVNPVSESVSRSEESKNIIIVDTEMANSAAINTTDPELAIAESNIIEVEEDMALETPPDFDVEELDLLALKTEDAFEVPGIEELNGGKIFTDLRKPIKVRIGMVLGPDANYVMTPSNKKQELDVFNQVAVGYSGGFTLGFKYSRLEFEMGALYSAVSYGSRNIYEIKGSFADGGYVQQGLQGAELDIVRLPLNLKYNFVEQGKWNVYAFSGISANMTVETFYNYTTQDLGLSDASRNFVGRDPSSPEIEPEAAIENYDGIFEGGSLSKNTFFSANLGFGVERHFTPRMSIFVQPNYQYQFSNGLGPQGDKINSLSILTGAKVTLKKRKK